MINSNPLVSICIPLYNAEELLSETMVSLLAQTYENIEIIIVDDGSTDGSLIIARAYAQKHRHIHVYSQPNSGASSARNHAFSKSKGEYIQYFDADDIMHPNKIVSQIEALRQYGFKDHVVATGRWMTFVDSVEYARFRKQVINKNYDNTFIFFKDSWENLEFVIGQAWLIPRKINKLVGNWNTNLSMNDDGEFFSRVAYVADKIVFVKEGIVYWRRGIPNSISASKSYKGLRSELASYHILYDLVKNNLDKYSLKKGLAIKYSYFYVKYFPLDTQMKNDICDKLKNLGYNQPIIEFNPKFSWIVKFFGVDVGLYLRRVKLKLFMFFTSSV